MRAPTWRATIFGATIAAGAGVAVGRWSVQTGENAADVGASSPLEGTPRASDGAAPDAHAVRSGAGSQTADARGAVDVDVSTAQGAGILDMGDAGARAAGDAAPGVGIDIARLKRIEVDARATAGDLAELARGHVALARDEVRILGGALRGAASDADRAATLGRLMRRAHDGAVAVDVVEALAAVPRADVADALDDLARRDDVPEAARLFAERVVRLPAFEEKVTPQLGLALSLGRAEACEVVASLVARAKTIGDERAWRRMARFEREDGCGRDRREDCYPCLRGSTALYEAREAAKARPFVPGWILPK